MKMKSFLLAALIVFAACSKEQAPAVETPGIPETPETPELRQSITFNLTANHPDARTRAVKTGWEAGDVIFVFFSGISSPFHLEMVYDGSSWTTREMGHAENVLVNQEVYTLAEPGPLELSNGMTGTMRAVYHPFGNNSTVYFVAREFEGFSFRFSEPCRSYYLTATLPYTVENNCISGTFNMQIPEGYVQFFVPADNPENGAFALGCDAIIPAGVEYIASDGLIIENYGTAADDLQGYAYQGGYLFSGKLDANYAYEGNYYFGMKRLSDGERWDYYVTGKTLCSHNAVKLPKAFLNPWQQVSYGRFSFWYKGTRKLTNVELKEVDWGRTNEEAEYEETYYISQLNSGATYPEDLGTPYGPSSSGEIADKRCLDFLNGRTKHVMPIHGCVGYVVELPRSMFLFIPGAKYRCKEKTVGDNSYIEYDYSGFAGVGNTMQTCTRDLGYSLVYSFEPYGIPL